MEIKEYELVTEGRNRNIFFGTPGGNKENIVMDFINKKYNEGFVVSIVTDDYQLSDDEILEFYSNDPLIANRIKESYNNGKKWIGNVLFLLDTLDTTDIKFKENKLAIIIDRFFIKRLL